LLPAVVSFSSRVLGTVSTLYLSYSFNLSSLPSSPTPRSSDLPLPDKSHYSIIIIRHILDIIRCEPEPDAVLIQHIPVAVEDLLQDRKSTRLNSSHVSISYAVFCLKKKNNT